MVALVLVVTGCGMGKNQNPVASDDELGRTRAESEEAKPATYVTREGDTLRSIASRPEIYSDADLWPLLLDANEAELGAVSPGKRLAGGKVLSIPRSLDVEQMDVAREKARQYAAAAKSTRRAKRPEADSTPVVKRPKPAATAVAPVKAPEPVRQAQPVPKAKSGGMLPILFLLLLVLAALGAVLYVFSRRDKQDKA